MTLRDLPRPQKHRILGGVLLAMTLGALDSTIVGPAMPVIVQDLGGMQVLTWVFTIYALTSTVTVPIVGKLSDLYGRKWFYLAGIGTFLVGSALCGAAPGMAWLIASRGLQGIGGGMMIANAMAIVGDLFEPRERGRYQGLLGSVFALSSVIGPAVGGWLTDAVSWRWIFYVNVPFGLLALAVLWSLLPRPERGRRADVDAWGALALVVGVVPLLLALTWGGSEHAWTSPPMLGLLGAAAVATVAFLFVERRAAEPILELGLFRDRGFAASMMVLFLSGLGLFSTVMLLPLFVQVVQGRSASGSGALLTPLMLGMVGASTATGQLVSRTGRTKVYGLVGTGLATLGMALLSRLHVDTSETTVVLQMVILGAGLGVTMPLFTISLQSRFPDRMGQVTGALQFFRQIGGTVGVALLGGVMNATFARELHALVVRHAAEFGAAEPVLLRLADEPSRLLNADALATVTAEVPPELVSVLEPFFVDVRLALTSGVTDAFVWGTVLLGGAFVAMWFVPEVPLAARPQLDSPAEVGRALMAESVQPPEHEPDVFEDLDAPR